MTTISHKRRNKGRGSRSLLLLVLCVVVAALLVVWRGPLTNAFWFVAAPLFEAGQGLVQGGELTRLRAELAATEAFVADRELLAAENAALKVRLGRLPEQTPTMLATVLVRPPATPYDTLVLDVGLKEGVAAGDLVFAGGSTLIGRVTEVYRSTSRATLYSAPGEVHEALLFAEGGSTPISIEGQGGGSLVGRLPQGTLITTGDFVIFPNIEPTFAARVSAVETKPGESFQTVYMQLPSNPFMLHYVEVRKPAL